MKTLDSCNKLHWMTQCQIFSDEHGWLLGHKLIGIFHLILAPLKQYVLVLNYYWSSIQSRPTCTISVSLVSTYFCNLALYNQDITKFSSLYCDTFWLLALNVSRQQSASVESEHYLRVFHNCILYEFYGVSQYFMIVIV